MGLFGKRSRTEQRSFADWQGTGMLFPPAGSGSDGVPVSEKSTLGLPAAWRAVNLIADAVASCPMQAFSGGEKVSPPPILNVSYDDKFAMTASLLLSGNAYAWVEFDDLAFPSGLSLLNSAEIQVSRVDGQKVFKVGHEVVPSEYILHIRGFCSPGSLIGIGVVEACREGLSAALSTQEHASRYFYEAAVPPLILETDITPSDSERESLRMIRDQWVESYARSRKPALLTSGLSAKVLAFNPKDSQFLESRQFSLSEIALMFGVPPYFLGGASQGMTYANTEQEALNLSKFSLRPWISRIEQGFSALVPAGTDVRMNMDSVLRADTSTRYAAHAVGIASGFITVDEVRALENLPPLGE